MFMFDDHLTLVQAPWLVPDDTRPTLRTPEPGDLVLHDGPVQCYWTKGEGDATLRRRWQARTVSSAR